MPRFLDVWKGTFVWIEDPKSVTYAILSHTWRAKGEQSFQDIRDLQESLRGAVPTSGPSDHPRTLFFHPDLSDKIRGIFKIVRDSGCRLLWIDACCIDKSSSAELSEAINSMYAWYTLADVCYVYLEDVSKSEDSGASEAAFRKSRWHTRGWTLQEFLAPERVVFLTQQWTFRGTKMTLAPLLEEITGIDLDVITGRAAVYSTSVARRMSWAARRCTTRIEDRAYSLLGIFGIHMSPIYGEGTNSFLRLQEEIARTIPDQTIFAWGRQCRVSTWTEDLVTAEGSTSSGLLAESPSDFATVGDVTPLSPRDFASRLGRDERDVPPLRCTFTSQGVHVDLIRVDLPSCKLAREGRVRFFQPCPACPPDPHHESLGPSLALLRCQDGSGSLIALPLCRSTTEESSSQLCLSIRTHIPCPHCLDTSSAHVPSSHNMRLTEDAFKAVRECIIRESMEVLLFRQQPRRLLQKSYYGYPIKCQPHPLVFLKASRVRISPDCTRALHTLGFTVHSPLRCQPSKRGGENNIVVISLMSHPRAHLAGSVDVAQLLEIQITLATAASDPKALVINTSVANYVHFSLQDVDNYTVSEGNTIRTPFGIAKKAPCPPGSVDSHSSLLGHLDLDHPSFEVETRILATAHFDIYADADWNSNTSYLKHLQVTLEYPPILRPDVNKGEGLWVSVELTEKYRAERPTGGAKPIHEPPPMPTGGKMYQDMNMSYWTSENAKLPSTSSVDTAEGLAAEMRLFCERLASAPCYRDTPVRDSDSEALDLFNLGPMTRGAIVVEDFWDASAMAVSEEHAEDPPEAASDNNLATVDAALTSTRNHYYHPSREMSPPSLPLGRRLLHGRRFLGFVGGLRHSLKTMLLRSIRRPLNLGVPRSLHTAFKSRLVNLVNGGGRRT